MVYDSIRGEIAFLSKEHVVLETPHVSYRILIPINVYTLLLGKNGTFQLFISEVVREDSRRFFGFQTRDERDFFEKLSDLSGIGPKTALAVVGHKEAVDLKTAVVTGDPARLTKIPGIGKKTAERLILELKGKIANLPDNEGVSDVKISGNQVLEDAIAALIHLGYAAPLAQKTVTKAASSFKDQYNLSELITTALKII